MLESLSEHKGADILQTLNTMVDDMDKKTKHTLLEEISDKSQEILKLKEALQNINEEVVMLREINRSSQNPFMESAGGSDNEDNKERASRTNKTESIPQPKRVSKIERENEEIEELTKLLNAEREKTIALTNELSKLKEDFESSKSKSRMLLVDQEKIIAKLKQGKNISASDEDDVKSQSSSKSKTSNTDSIVDPITGMLNAFNDQCTLDYLRNIFVKYLVYITKKPKKAEQCEKLIFTMLNITEEQIAQINKARKKSKIWDWFKNMRGTNRDFNMETLDMNLNFTMTEVGNHSHIGGFTTDGLYGVILDDTPLGGANLGTAAVKKKKKVKKAKKKTAVATNEPETINEVTEENNATPEKHK